jgi:LPS-assembly lipoprotein
MKTFSRIVLVAAALGLAGCGFSPLYGTTDAGSPVALKLASISVAEQDNRLGQLVRNEIVSGISPAGSAGSIAYRLELTAVGSENLAIGAVDTESLRKHYRVNVSFVLYDSSTDKPVYSGKTFSQVSYDRIDAPVANLQAQVDAQERAAAETGSDIRTRLAAFMSTQ